MGRHDLLYVCMYVMGIFEVMSLFQLDPNPGCPRRIFQLDQMPLLKVKQKNRTFLEYILKQFRRAKI